MDRDSYKSLAEAYQEIHEKEGVFWDAVKGMFVPGSGPSQPASDPRDVFGDSPMPNFDRIPPGNKFKNNDRPPGWYKIKVGGKDVARYWPGNQAGPGEKIDWKVNGPRGNSPLAQGGLGQATDPRAADIRQAEADRMNQGTVRGAVDTAGNVAAGSIAIPMTTWSGLTTGAQNAWNSASRAYQGKGSVRAGGKPTGQFVTPGARYPSEKGGKWGYTVYDEKGNPKWTEDSRATPFGDRVQGIKDFATGQNQNLPVVPGLTPPSAGGSQDPPPSGGGSQDAPPSGGGSQDAPPSDQGSTPTNTDGSDVTQRGPNSAGLTPMQQWAKNFPQLAAKVKQGQAGYDEIQKMTSKAGTNFSDIGGRLGTALRDTQNDIIGANGTQKDFSRAPQPTNVSRNFQSSAPNLGSQTGISTPSQTRSLPADSGRNVSQNFERPAPISTQPAQTSASSQFSSSAPNLAKAAGIKAIASRVPKAPTPPKPPKPMNRLDQATTNVGKWNEETLLQSLADAYNDISEGHPEPKVHWQKDMEPYDRRRMPGMHAPGSPLPPPVPGIPDFLKKASKKTKDERKPKTA